MDDRRQHHRELIQRMVIESLWHRAGEELTARLYPTDQVGIAGPIAERGHRLLTTNEGDAE